MSHVAVFSSFNQPGIHTSSEPCISPNCLQILCATTVVVSAIGENWAREVVEVYRPEASAWKGKHRAALDRALADARAGRYDVLMVIAAAGYLPQLADLVLGLLLGRADPRPNGGLHPCLFVSPSLVASQAAPVASSYRAQPDSAVRARERDDLGHGW